MRERGGLVNRIGANQINKAIPAAQEGVQTSVNQALTGTATSVGDAAGTAVSSAFTNAAQPLVQGAAKYITAPLGVADSVVGGANTLYQGGKKALSGAYNYITGRSSQAGGLDNSGTFSRENTQRLNQAGFASDDYRRGGSGYFSNQSDFTGVPSSSGGGFFSRMFRRNNG